MKNKNENKEKNPLLLLKRLLSYIVKNYKLACFMVVVCILVSALTTLCGTLFIQKLIDNYIVPLTQMAVPDYSPLAQALLKLVAIFAVGVLCSYGYNRIMVNVGQGTMKKLRTEMFTNMESLPIRYFDTHAHGDIMSVYTNDIDTLRQLISQSIPQVLNSLITLVSTFVSMIVLDIPLTIVSVIMVAIMLFVTSKLSAASGRYFIEQQKDIGKVNAYIEEMMEGQKVVKVFSREEEEIHKFEKLNDALLAKSVRAEVFSGSIGPIMTAINNMTYAIVVAVGGILMVIGNGMTLGIISNFIIYSKQFARPLTELANQVNTILSAMAGAERVFEVLDEEEEKPDAPDAYEMGEIEGDVELKDVSFSYEKGHPILKHINLYARPGQTIAFVGPTGAGKTTIINLLTRFYDIDSGSITIDGHDIYQTKRDSLRSALSIVLQDTYLFTDSIKENIRYGRLNATDEEIKAAAKLANAHEFIRRLPDGYDTMLTDGGGNLSQGQRQMISIARAILANPSVLILDEATSSVDTRTEVKIQEAMHNLMKGRTNFVIAHRLSTIKDADLIAVVEHGEIIERGNHEQLMAKKGFYYNLYTNQFDQNEAV